MNPNLLFNIFLMFTTIATSQAGIVHSTLIEKHESKATCPVFLQNDPTLPCWTLMNGKCYCFSTYNRLDWVKADAFCRDENMRLLTVETYEEDQIVFSQVKSMSSVDYYWTSGQFSNNRWEWASTEPFQPLTYTNWYEGEPSNSQIGSFAYINFNFASDQGFWFDEIGSAYILFICESIDGGTATTTTTPSTTTPSTTTPSTTTPSTTTPSTTTPSTTTPSTTTETTTPTITTEAPLICPTYLQGNTGVPCWTLGSKCYCYSQLERDWTGADSFCRGGDMTLLQIESDQENDMIYNHYLARPEITQDIYWTAGRYSRDGNNLWEWATTQPYEPFNYTNWSQTSNPPQPDFCIIAGDCNPAYAERFSVDISFYFGGRWYDVDNTYEMKFICESVE